MSYLLSIGTSSPAYMHQQKDILDFMMQQLPSEEKKAKRTLPIIYKMSGIDSRFSVIPDFTSSLSKRELFPDDDFSVPSLEERMKLFKEYAGELLLEAVEEALSTIDKSSITHIITVTCTGLSAPGLDIELIEKLNLPSTTFRQSVNFMGCFAAFHALRQADYICRADKNAKVLIADVELCTLHYQKETSEDHLVANALFSDGAAAAVIAGEGARGDSNIKIEKFHSETLLDDKDKMAWELSSYGFLMTLSSYIPEILGGKTDELIQAVFGEHFSHSDDYLWAIHPGGRRILDKFQQAAHLHKDQLQNSYDVLKKYGNMSSVTILFVLKRFLNEMLESRKPLFAAGFGPGLTMETMMLKYEQKG